MAARVTLTFSGLSHAAALALSDRIENDFQIDPLAVSINETDEANEIWETRVWFDDDTSAVASRTHLQWPTATIAAVPDIDWVRRSLEGLAPVKAGRFFLFGSHDQHLRKVGGISLKIDAGTAFGTGHHATTSSCLLALDDILKRHRPARILDLGCGTGVLAIAAAKALKHKALATDIDAEAIRVTLGNAKHNDAAPFILTATAAGLHHPVFSKHGPFDLIFANILARPLASLAQSLSRILAPGGHLILSGLTRDQLRWIKACYANRGLTPSRVIQTDNWITLVMRNPK